MRLVIPPAAVLLLAASAGCGRAEREPPPVQAAPAAPEVEKVAVFAPALDTAAVPPAVRGICQGVHAAPPRPAPAERTRSRPHAAARPVAVYTSELSGFHAAVRCVVRSVAEWDSVRAAGRISAGFRPGPDFFQGEMLLVVASGVRPATGYHPSVDSLYLRGDTLTAVAREHISQVGGDMGTAPVSVVRVPRTDGPVEFAERSALLLR